MATKDSTEEIIVEMKDETELQGEAVSEAVINCDATISSEGSQSSLSQAWRLTIDDFQIPMEETVVMGLTMTQRQTLPNVKKRIRQSGV